MFLGKLVGERERLFLETLSESVLTFNLVGERRIRAFGMSIRDVECSSSCLRSWLGSVDFCDVGILWLMKGPGRFPS